MKRIIILFIVVLLAASTFSQTRFESFISSTAKIYSSPDESALTEKTISVFKDITVIGIVGNFYEIEGYGFVKENCVYHSQFIVYLVSKADCKLYRFKDVDKYEILKQGIKLEFQDYDTTDNFFKVDYYLGGFVHEDDLDERSVNLALWYYYKYRIYDPVKFNYYSKKIKEDSIKIQKEMKAARKKRLAEEKQRIANKKKAEQDKQRNIIKKYGQETGQKILERKVWIGMTKEMAIDSWGKPTDINRTITVGGVHEQWVYSGRTYLYFDDGKLTTIQD